MELLQARLVRSGAWGNRQRWRAGMLRAQRVPAAKRVVGYVAAVGEVRGGVVRGRESAQEGAREVRGRRRKGAQDEEAGEWREGIRGRRRQAWKMRR